MGSLCEILIGILIGLIIAQLNSGYTEEVQTTPYVAEGNYYRHKVSHMKVKVVRSQLYDIKSLHKNMEVQYRMYGTRQTFGYMSMKNFNEQFEVLPYEEGDNIDE